MSDKLKPCPFCGCSNISSMESLDWVACERCGATFEDVEPSAVECWNARAALSAQPQPEAVEAVRYSFGDYHIGTINSSGMALDKRLVERPEGLTNIEWYRFAGSIIRLLNTAPPIAHDERMRKALEKLKNEVVGMLALGESGMRHAVGNTNVSCLQQRVKEAEEALSGAADASNAGAEARLRDETGWLIEKDDPPVYHLVTDDYDEHWTPDASKALRFSRREDAQAYSDHIGWTSPPVRIVEHMWPAPAGADDGKESEGGKPIDVLATIDPDYAESFDRTVKCSDPTPADIATAFNTIPPEQYMRPTPAEQREAVARKLEILANDLHSLAEEADSKGERRAVLAIASRVKAILRRALEQDNGE